MSQENPSYNWQQPWYELEEGEEQQGIQRQYEREIIPPHPLFGQGGTVIGRRMDCDDVVVVLHDGTYVNVHLVWSSAPSVFPDRWPSWFAYGSQDDFIQAMIQDGLDDHGYDHD